MRSLRMGAVGLREGRGRSVHCVCSGSLEPGMGLAALTLVGIAVTGLLPDLW